MRLGAEYYDVLHMLGSLCIEPQDIDNSLAPLCRQPMLS